MLHWLSIAVLGSSGQGKTHFVSAALQRLIQAGPRARIVIFDVHDEYGSAFRDLDGVNLSETVLGTPQPGDTREHFRIPYYALAIRARCVFTARLANLKGKKIGIRRTAKSSLSDIVSPIAG